MSRDTLVRAISGGVAFAALTIGGVALSAGPASAQPSAPWDAIARCESGGNWSIDTGNGYFGGLQFSPATWAAFGGRGSAAHATRAQQIVIGERVAARQGWNAWSSCSARLGLSGHLSMPATHAAAHVHHQRPHHEAVSHRVVAQPHDQLFVQDVETKRPEHESAHPKQQEHHRDHSKAAEHRAHAKAAEHRTAHAKAAEHHRAGPRHAAVRTGRHAAAPAVGRSTYTVRGGDTLQAIAERLHVAGGWQALADVNIAHLAHPAQIFPGQVLHLPAH